MIQNLKLYAIGAAALVCFGAGYKVGQWREMASASSEIAAAKDELYSCKETVIEMNMQATNSIVDQQLKINEVAKNADTQIQELETHINNSADIADRLREQLKKAMRDSRTCKSYTEPSSGSDKAEDMLPDLYSRLVNDSRELAEYADKVTIAHQACLNSH